LSHFKPLLYCELEYETRYSFVLDHPVVNNYFRHQSSTRIFDKKLDRVIEP